MCVLVLNIGRELEVGFVVIEEGGWCCCCDWFVLGWCVVGLICWWCGLVWNLGE